jgi:hypothetical protein
VSLDIAFTVDISVVSVEHKHFHYCGGARLSVIWGIGKCGRIRGKKGMIAREISRGDETAIFRDREGRLLLVQ